MFNHVVVLEPTGLSEVPTLGLAPDQLFSTLLVSESLEGSGLQTLAFSRAPGSASLGLGLVFPGSDAAAGAASPEPCREMHCPGAG